MLFVIPTLISVMNDNFDYIISDDLNIYIKYININII